MPIAMSIIGIAMTSRIMLPTTMSSTRLSTPSTPLKGVSWALTMAISPIVLHCGAQQVEHEEIGHQIDRRGGVREILQELRDARLGPHRQRDVDRIDLVGPTDLQQIVRVAGEGAVDVAQILPAIRTAVVIDAHDAEAEPGPLGDLLAESTRVDGGAENHDVADVAPLLPHRAQREPHDDPPAAQNGGRQREPAKGHDARVLEGGLRREREGHQHGDGPQPGQRDHPQLDVEPLDAPGTVDAAQLGGDDEPDHRRQRRVAGLAPPGLVISEGGGDVRDDDPEDIGQALNPVDDVFVLAKQVEPEPPDIKRSAFATLGNWTNGPRVVVARRKR